MPAARYAAFDSAYVIIIYQFIDFEADDIDKRMLHQFYRYAATPHRRLGLHFIAAHRYAFMTLLPERCLAAADF